MHSKAASMDLTLVSAQQRPSDIADLCPQMSPTERLNKKIYIIIYSEQFAIQWAGSRGDPEERPN